MPRIFKGSESTLRLLIHTCNQEGTISDLKIALYTSDPSMAVEFTDRYIIEGNIVSLTVPNYAFGTMEEGVINYVAQGMIGDDTFITERQSNYFLKTPANYTPTPMPEEVVLGELTAMIAENGVFEYTPSDVDAWNKATIEVNVPSEGGDCNLGEGEIYLTASDAGFYELYAADDGYDGWSKFIVTLENGGAIKVFKAEELIQMFNEGWGIDFGAYYYVGGQITDITEVSMEWGNATYTLDNGFSVYRGKWFDGNRFDSEDQIKVGAYIVVYGIIQEHNGVLGFKVNSQVIAYQECEGGEIVSCNIQEYKWVRPSWSDRAENGDIYIYPDEGFDAVGYIDLDPNDIYNEAYNEGIIAGKAEGGGLNLGEGYIGLTENERGQTFELIPSNDGYDAYSKVTVELHNFDLGGDCNLGILNMEATNIYLTHKYAADDGLDGYSEIIVRTENLINQEKENAINEFKNNMDEITITENGTYSIDDVEIQHSITFDGNSYFNTGIVPTENIKIEVCIRVTDGNDAGMGGIIIGGGIDSVNDSTENRGIAIGMGGGAIYGKWGTLNSWNNPYDYEGTTTVVLQKTDDSFGWESEKGSFGAASLYIGGYNKNGEEVEDKFMQSIVYIKIWTDKNDDSTMTLFRPKNMAQGGFGLVNSEGTEYSNVENLGSGTTTFVEEYVNKYPNGFKRVEVNVDTQTIYNEGVEEGQNKVRNKLQSIDITENGRYSTDDQIYVDSLRYNGGYHTDTISTYDINRIEVTFKADTSEAINGQGRPFILGGSLWSVEDVYGTDNDCARAIQYANGRIVGYWEGKWTDAASTMDGEWLTIILDENGMNVKYPTSEDHKDYTHDNGNTNGGADIFPFIIGGQGKRKNLEDGSYTSSLIEDSQFRGLIKEVKINTNSMGEITYISNNWGYGVWARKVENTGENLSALEPTEGEVTMNGDWEAKYGEGWKEINVNVDTQTFYNQGFADATSFDKIAMEIETDLYNKLEFLTDHSFVTTNDDNSPKSLMFDTPINYIWSYRDVSDGIAKLKENAFKDYSIIRKVKTNTIMTLDERAFKDAFELTEIEMSNFIGYIATEAFDGCSKLAKIICSATGDVVLGSAPFNGLPENGVLYLKEGVDETPWLEKLPSGWTVERI